MTLEDGDILKKVWNISTIFCYLMLDLHVESESEYFTGDTSIDIHSSGQSRDQIYTSKTGTRFSLQDKSLFKISEVKIT